MNNKRRSYVGLSNQGATCYMNSLLQTLFMTPEFRSRIYQWQYDPAKHGPVQDCIPLQLQLIFARLQTTEHAYIETTGLTKSFQWDIRESFQQHDVQEFCRVLFEAIEESVRDTDQHGMIKELYEGTLIDYVKCLECNNESRREDRFLDLSLTVRSQFDHIYNDSIEKALYGYVHPWHLEGDDQYHCSNCDAKRDALKGLKFKDLPYILVLQLMRFDLDYTTLQRKKLNDRVAFPMVLNMNTFLRGTLELPEELVRMDTISVHSIEAEEIPDITPENIDSLSINYITSTAYEHITSDLDKHTQPLDAVAVARYKQLAKEKKRLEKEYLIARYKQQGDAVYELYSIMIHSGSALGGHYYAYIKSFEDDSWYEFNDTNVREIDDKQIENVFGDSSGGYNSYSGANAYLLMYRKVSSDNIHNISNESIPEYVHTLLEQERQEYLRYLKEKEDKLMRISFKVYYGNRDETIVTRKDTQLKYLKQQVISLFNLSSISESNIRLRNYNYYQDIYCDTFDGLEDETLDELRIFNHSNLVVEVKDNDAEFESYDPNQMSLKVFVWNDAFRDRDEETLEQRTQNPWRIQIPREFTVFELCQRLTMSTGIEIDRLYVYKKNPVYSNIPLELINIPFNLPYPASYAKVFDGTVLYIEAAELDGKSNWFKEFEEESFKYLLKFNDPRSARDFCSNPYPFKLLIDNRKTVSDLRHLLSHKLELPSSEFIIRRNSKQGQELKDPKASLSEMNLNSGSILHLELGQPALPDEYRIELSLAEKYQLIDNSLFRLYPLLTLPIDQNLTVVEMKKIICIQVKQLYPSMQLQPEFIRIREQNTNNSLGRVFAEDENVSYYKIYEGKKMAIEVLSSPDTFTSQDLLVIVRSWSPNTWELSEYQDVILPKNSHFDKLGEILASKFGIEVLDM